MVTVVLGTGRATLMQLLANDVANQSTELISRRADSEGVLLNSAGLQIVEPLAYRSHIGDGGGILNRQSIKGKESDSFHYVPHLLSFRHVLVDPAAQREDIFNVRSIGLFGALKTGIKLLFG